MTADPHVRVDLQHRMLSVRLNDGTIAWTDQIDDAHLVDVDADGRVVGLDIMTLDDFKIDQMAEQFGFRDQAPAVKAAIQKAMAPRTAGSYGAPLIVQGTPAPDLSAVVETENPSTPPIVPPIVVS
jgi:hypothetical protein